jgi:outer membrane lipoprotein-sorting protein
MSLRRPGPADRLVRLSALLLLAALSLFAVAAWAGPKEDMKALSVKFLALRSYHATMTSSDARVPKTEMDFVAPNRYRIDSGMGAQVIIGDTMYMTIDGRTMRIPMPKGTLTQWRQSDRAFREIERAQIEALGTEVVDGKPMKKYRMVQTFDGNRSETLLWIGANGLPAKMQTTGTAGRKTYTTTVVYSRFNDPAIRIDPPK